MNDPMLNDWDSFMVYSIVTSGTKIGLPLRSPVPHPTRPRPRFFVLVLLQGEMSATVLHFPAQYRELVGSTGPAYG